MRWWMALLLITGCGGNKDDTSSKGDGGDNENDAANDDNDDKPPKEDPEYPPAVIGFGSCSDSTSAPMPVLADAAAAEPDLYIWLGDNVYADTEDMDVMREKYAHLGAAPEFQALAAATDFLVTWDDRDYGADDAGFEYPRKAESKEVFLEFWEEPADSARRDHDGIYNSYRYLEGENTLQVIILDMRTFRDPLTLNDGSGIDDTPYMPTADEGKTMLGEDQWTWLESQLEQDADLRLLISSIQLGHEHNGYESWTNMPHERARLLTLIKDTDAEGLIVLSGDVHWGEISREHIPNGYDFYDITSSAINRPAGASVSLNANRIGDPVPDNNFGLLEIDWEKRSVTASIRIAGGAVATTHTFAFDELRF